MTQSDLFNIYLVWIFFSLGFQLNVFALKLTLGGTWKNCQDSAEIVSFVYDKAFWCKQNMEVILIIMFENNSGWSTNVYG